jgi:predicted acyltransferase
VGALAPRLGAYGEFVRELAAFAIVWLILLFMYRRKIFIKV